MAAQTGLDIPRTPMEDVLLLREFANTERAWREHMMHAQPMKADYWRSRVADADEALDAIGRLMRLAERLEGEGT
jgi:hypothetical protein